MMLTVVEGHRQTGEDYSIAYSREIDKVDYACHFYTLWHTKSLYVVISWLPPHSTLCNGTVPRLIIIITSVKDVSNLKLPRPMGFKLDIS